MRITNSRRSWPFELVGAALEETDRAERWLRDLPSRVGICFLLAMCLSPEVGYRLVWDKMTAALSRQPVVSPRRRRCATCAAGWTTCRYGRCLRLCAARRRSRWHPGCGSAVTGRSPSMAAAH
ncbi:transposase domain-containing protein [Spirillospora sp. CA-255316]